MLKTPLRQRYFNPLLKQPPPSTQPTSDNLPASPTVDEWGDIDLGGHRASQSAQSTTRQRRVVAFLGRVRWAMVGRLVCALILIVLLAYGLRGSAQRWLHRQRPSERVPWPLRTTDLSCVHLTEAWLAARADEVCVSAPVASNGTCLRQILAVREQRTRFTTASIGVILNPVTRKLYGNTVQTRETGAVTGRTLHATRSTAIDVDGMGLTGGTPSLYTWTGEIALCVQHHLDVLLAV